MLININIVHSRFMYHRIIGDFKLIIIDEDLCKGCHLCLFMCYKNVYAISSEVNKKGVQLPFVKFEER